MYYLIRSDLNLQEQNKPKHIIDFYHYRLENKKLHPRFLAGKIKSSKSKEKKRKEK